jgi:hypothetical protein
MRTTKHILLLLVTIAGFAAIAQAQVRHEFSVSAGGGISSLNYKIYDDARLLWGFGGEAALNYTYFINAKWGIGTGAALAMYNSTALMNGTVLNGISNKDYPKDYEDDPDESYRLTTTLHRYEERQRMFSLNVPLYLQYQIAGRHPFYMRIGGKLVLPMLIPATYEVKNGIISNNAYKYKEDGVTLDDKPKEDSRYGWGKDYAVTHNGNLKLTMGVMLSAEVGTKWQLTRRNSLYMGLYVDYGAFLDMHSPDQRSLVIDNVPEERKRFRMNSILHSEDGTGTDILKGDMKGDPLAKMVSPVAIGVVLRMSFGYKSVAPAKERPDIVDTLVINQNDTIYMPIHDTVVVTKTETLYRELAEGGAETAPGNLLVRRDTVLIYRELHHHRTDTFTNNITKVDTVRVYKYNQNFIISNYLASATYVSGEKKATLDHVVSMLISHPRASVIVEGHTCDYGSDKINEVLGMRRAQTVSAYLVQNGIMPDRIKVVSKGNSEPIALNDSENNRRKNRRVKLIIVDGNGNDY